MKTSYASPTRAQGASLRAKAGRASWILFLVLGLNPPTDAADGDIGPYFNFDAGPNWVQSVHATSGPYSGTADLDVGARFGMSFGYNIHRNVGVEFETGWIWNDFRGSDYTLTQVPFLLNGVLRYPNYTGFEPYLGAGVGGVFSNFGINDCCGDFDSDFVFAWQGMAGVRYHINPSMSVGLGYKYLGAMGGDYEVYGIRSTFNTMHNHSVGLVFNMKF